MRQSTFPGTAALFACVFALSAQTPSGQPEAQGLPPRATPADYQAQAKAGTVTVGAEFSGHSVPTLDGPLTTEDYVVVEVGLFGPSGARLTLSPEDFALRINGKKAPSPSQPYALVLKSLKDPTWVPPEPPEGKAKTSVGSAMGLNGGNDTPKIPPKPPFELQRTWQKRAQKAALPEGDRPLPQAGVLFFEFGGKPRSLELIYKGPAGKFTVPLQP
jgi:hypothetical protein